MSLTIIILIAGLLLIIVGADQLTSWSVKIATHLGIPELIVGLTIVAIGTSAPEIVVSITSALKQQSQMAVGNVIGSNLFNSLVIIGLCALIRPMPLSKSNVKRNIPPVVISSILLLVMMLSIFGVEWMPSQIIRIDGIILLLSFIFFIYKSVKGSASAVKAECREQAAQRPKFNMLLAIGMVVASLAALIYGGDIFLSSAIELARSAGVSEYIISVTLMAAGTSLPELAACIAAARRGRSQLILGNIIGSNVSNILLVLGLSSIISPLDLTGVSMVDISLVVLSSLLLILTSFTFTKARIDRYEGVIFVGLYVAYIIYLL